jgi:hypothetical protein
MNMSLSLLRAVAAASLLVGCFGAAYAAGTSLAVAAPRNHQTQVDSNRGVTRAIIQTSDSPTFFTSTAFQQLTGGSISVPATHKGILVATFTAESLCGGAAGQCAVRILCDGVDLLPTPNIDFAFNSVGAGAQSSSVTRRTNPFTGGVHFCEVQSANSTAGLTHQLDDWTFVVEFWRQ